jgi:polyribonucleotide nucleotidyltransferase
MDFKVCNRSRITGFQMDIKIREYLRDVETALSRLKRAGCTYSKMLEVMDKPRPNISPYAPHLYR